MSTHQVLVTELAHMLQQKQWSIVTAESCTGGGLAYAITLNPECSCWLERGLVTYSAQAKIDCLNIDEKIFSQHFAVSEYVAKAMAKGALTISNADFSIAITGIAGPNSDDSKQAVGTVWIACASHNDKIIACLQHFSGNREQICQQAIQAALTQALQWLKHLE